MKSDYQLIVIGAGPAGSYAALTAAKAGIKVLLVERDAEVGKPLTCAEAVSVSGLAKFVTPEREFIANDIFRLHLETANGATCSYETGEQLGYVLDRPRFDSHLAAQAVAAGATLLTSTYASGISIDDSGSAVIELQSAGGAQKLKADFVVAADGVESMIGRMAGIDTRQYPQQAEATLQYRVSGIELDPRNLQVFVGQKYSFNGYLWVFPKSDCSANVGLGSCVPGKTSEELHTRLDSFMAERFPKGKIDFVTCGMVPKFSGYDLLGRHNLLLAGDAARTIDSLTGAGITKALHTGQLAARAISEAIEKGYANRELQNSYRTLVNQEMGRELRFYQNASPIFRKFDDRDWDDLTNSIAKVLEKKTAGPVDPVAVVKAVLTMTPRLLRLARHLI
jgi:digeranylgeranylglycerophospholipid reductase